MGQKKIRAFEKMWVLSLPRIAREVAGFAQDVKWLVGVAKDAWRPPARSEAPEVEMATEWRCQARAEPEPWAREYEAWDPGWTLVRTSNDPFYSGQSRVM